MSLIGISAKAGAGKTSVANLIHYHLACKRAQDNPGSPIYTTPTFTVEQIVKDNIDLSIYSGWKTKLFAYKLKKFVANIIGCKVEDLEKQEVKSMKLPKEWNKTCTTYRCSSSDPIEKEPMTVRDMLIGIGDGLRREVHPDIWVNSLMSDYKDESINPCFSKGKCMEADSFGKTEDEFDICKDGCVQQKPLYPNWIIADMRYKNEFKRIKELGGITIRVQRDDAPGNNSTHISECDLDEYCNNGKESEFDWFIGNNGTIEQLSRRVKLILTDLKLI